MKNLIYLVVFFIITCSNLNAELSYNAITLALRQQTTVRLDYQLAYSIDSMLTSAVQADTALISIWALPEFLWDEMIIQPLSGRAWVDSLLNGHLVTGDKYIDSLNKAFHLIKVEDLSGEIVMTFDDTLEIMLVSELYKKHPDVVYAQPNYLYTNED